MTYPAKPVLIGKVVRCKECKNAFSLQADGVAIKSLAEVTVPTPEAPPPTQVSTSPPRPGTDRNPRVKNEQLEAARQKMAAELSAVAAKAANSEVAKREERRSERLVKVGGTGKAADDAKRSKRTAVLTGEGDRLHREGLYWGFGALIVVGVVALTVMAFSIRGPTRAALEAYCAAVPSDRRGCPEMGQTIQARAWMLTSPSQPSGPLIATGLSDATLGTSRSMDVGGLAKSLAELKGLRLVADLGWWVEPANQARLAAVFAGRPVGERGRLAAMSRIPAIEHAAWLKRLDLPPEDQAVLVDLLAGKPSPEGIDFAKRMLDGGDVPDRLHLRSFSGKRGEMRLDVGSTTYLFKVMPYHGTLARFEGVGWSTNWRVLELR